MQNKPVHSRNFAAVDIGTNSFHLIIVNVDENGTLTIINREKDVIRLGSQKGDELSFLSKEEINKGVEILKTYKRISDFNKAKMHAIATSAVREAENKQEFINEVLRRTNIEIEVIDGKKECEYIYKGVKKALPYKNKKLLCMDIGGGSTEFILGFNDDILFSESLKIGAVRLSKKFFPDFILTNEGMEKCKEYINEQLRMINFSKEFDIAVGASGTILAAAGMINYRRNEKKDNFASGFAFTKKELEELTKEILNKKTSEERTDIEGMEYKRADIIPAGLLILNEVFEFFKIKEMIISTYALREGVVLKMLDEEKEIKKD